MKKRRFTPFPPAVCFPWIAACIINGILCFVKMGTTLPEFNAATVGIALIYAVTAAYWIWQFRLSRRPDSISFSEAVASIFTPAKARTDLVMNAVLVTNAVLAIGGLIVMSVNTWNTPIRYPGAPNVILVAMMEQTILLAFALSIIGGAYDIFRIVRRRAATPTVTVEDAQAGAVAPPTRTWWTNDETREEVRNQSQRP